MRLRHRGKHAGLCAFPPPVPRRPESGTQYGMLRTKELREMLHYWGEGDTCEGCASKAAIVGRLVALESSLARDELRR